MNKLGELKPSWIQGYDGTQIFHLDENTICYKAGDKLQLHDLKVDKRKLFESPGNGVDKIATHPAKLWFAISELGLQPSIYVCDYMLGGNVILQLTGGAVMQYQQIVFSEKRDYLVGISGVPDFTAFVWDCKDGKLLCQTALTPGDKVTSIMFSDVNYNMFAIATEENVQVFTIQRCNELYQLYKREIIMPAYSLETGTNTEGKDIIKKARNLTYRSMHEASIAGLAGPAVDVFVAPEKRLERFVPTSISWYEGGGLLVGGRSGQLILITHEFSHIKVLLDTPADEEKENFYYGMFSKMVWSTKRGVLLAAGEDGRIRKLDLSSSTVSIKLMWKSESLLKYLSLSPQENNIVVASEDNGIDMISLSSSQTISSFTFFTGQFVAIDENINHQIITCRDNGYLQVWNRADGKILADISLNTPVASLACSPLVNDLIVVGTCSGHLIFLDAGTNDEGGLSLRIVQITRMYPDVINCVRFDEQGRFLLVSSSLAKKIYVVDGTPSSQFECIGYITCPRNVKSLQVNSTLLSNKSIVTAILVNNKPKSDEDPPASDVVVFRISASMLDKADKYFKTGRCDFDDSAVGLQVITLNDEVDSATVIRSTDINYVIAVISSFDKAYVEYQAEQGMPELEQVAVEIARDDNNHKLTGGIIKLSNNGRVIMTSSYDGYVIMRNLDNPVKDRCEKHFHSYLNGGTRDIHFLSDGSGVASIGAKDASVNFYKFKATRADMVTNMTLYQQKVTRQIEPAIEKEKNAMTAMQDWIPAAKSPTPPGSRASSSRSGPLDDDDVTAEVDIKMAATAEDAVDDSSKREKSVSEVKPPATATDTMSDDVTMTPTPSPCSDSTWLEQREAEWKKEDNSKFDEYKKNLRKNIKKLRKTILRLRDRNSRLPDIEKLDLDEFNLDKQQLQQMRSIQEETLRVVREEIRFENLTQRYLAHEIRKECWDEMDTKGRSLKPLKGGSTVSNYPMKRLSKQEIRTLQQVKRKRQLELNSQTLLAELEAKASKSTTSTVTATDKDGETDNDYEAPDNADEAEGTPVVKSLSLHGSLGPKILGRNSLFYSQLELHNRESKISQIVLLKEEMRKIKDEFNKEFNTVYKTKEHELDKMNERNDRIRYIQNYIHEAVGTEFPPVIDDVMDVFEKPEKALIVEDHEVKVERILTEEQQREKEIQDKKDEEKRRLAAADNKRERGLKDMMDGVLQVKREDLLRHDIPIPEYVLEKEENDFNMEEIQGYKEYQEKVKELEVEREKFRKSMEAERRKLIQVNADARQEFDDVSLGLFQKKIKAELMVNQEEMKIVRLIYAILLEDEQNIHKNHANYLIEVYSKIMVQRREELEEAEMIVDDYNDVVDNAVAEDKILERAFKREFADQPLSLVEVLFKHFKKRPKMPRAPQASTMNFYKASSKPPEIAKITKEMIERDFDSHMPEGVSEDVWQRLCRARLAKIECETKVRETSLMLIEIKHFCDMKKAQVDKCAATMDRLIQLRNRVQDENMKAQLNLNVQFLLKQGQVESKPDQLVPNYTDCTLLMRTVIEDLNSTIKTLGLGKVAAMLDSKEFKIAIHQLEWEKKKMVMQMEDLQSRAKYIQGLKLTRSLQAYLSEEDYESQQAHLLVQLEATYESLENEHKKKLKRLEDATQELQRSIRLKGNENKELDRVLEELILEVSERHNINNVNANTRSAGVGNKKMKQIVQRRRLVELAKAQAQEVAVMRAEVERLRMKTFPALVQIDH